eukprot:SAG11_NODE_46_length_20454_cov_11.499386_1_plen_64_part_00
MHFFKKIHCIINTTTKNTFYNKYRYKTQLLKSGVKTKIHKVCVCVFLCKTYKLCLKKATLMVM